MHRNILSGVISLLLSCTLFAQNGWESVKKNDYKKAKEEFLSVLQKDSTDASALKGIIYLSETSGDELSYSKYINTLINSHWDESTYLLFGDEYKGNSDKVLAQTKLSGRARIDAELSKADQDFYHRKFDESRKVYDKLFGNYQWTYAGPFKNLNGSGYETKFEIESDTYSPDKIYKDEDGQELKWVNPPVRDNSQPVTFRDFLMSDNSAVYFANLFFEVPVERNIQLRITRKDPIKLWLDGDLVYSNNDNSSMEWDNEIVEVKVGAGTHRLLVKLADYNPDGKMNDLFGNYNLDDIFSSSLYDRNYSSYDRSNANNGDFQVRITDANGNLMTDVKTYASANYSNNNYHPDVHSFFVLGHFIKATQDDPSDL